MEKHVNSNKEFLCTGVTFDTFDTTKQGTNKIVIGKWVR